MKKIFIAFFIVIGVIGHAVAIQAQEVNIQKDTLIDYVPQLVAKETPLEPNPEYIYKTPELSTQPNNLLTDNIGKNLPSFFPKTGSAWFGWFYVVGILLTILSTRLLLKKGEIK